MGDGAPAFQGCGEHCRPRDTCLAGISSYRENLACVCGHGSKTPCCERISAGRQSQGPRRLPQTHKIGGLLVRTDYFPLEDQFIRERTKFYYLVTFCLCYYQKRNRRAGAQRVPCAVCLLKAKAFHYQHSLLPVRVDVGVIIPVGLRAR